MAANVSKVRIAASAALTATVLLAGCGGTSSTQESQASTGALPAADPEMLKLADAAAAEAAHERAPMRAPKDDRSAESPGDSPIRITRASQTPGDATQIGETPTSEPAPTEVAGPVAAPAPTLAEQISTKAEELRRLLRENASLSAPLTERLAIASIDAFVAAPPKAEATSLVTLSPAETAVNKAARDVFEGLAAEARTGASPAKVSDLLVAAADAISSQAPIRIGYAGLCRKVESFGSYEPIESMSFLAGRNHRAIVYVELDRFASRAPVATDSPGVIAGRWVAEVSQELELIHDADGRQQWYRPPQTVVDTSRTRRRDFYLVNTIDLPATLSVGAYSLKVTIRDKTTGASDERVIPLQVIADQSATLSPRAAAK